MLWLQGLQLVFCFQGIMKVKFHIEHPVLPTPSKEMLYVHCVILKMLFNCHTVSLLTVLMELWKKHKMKIQRKRINFVEMNKICVVITHRGKMKNLLWITQYSIPIESIHNNIYRKSSEKENTMITCFIYFIILITQYLNTCSIIIMKGEAWKSVQIHKSIIWTNFPSMNYLIDLFTD